VRVCEGRRDDRWCLCLRERREGLEEGVLPRHRLAVRRAGCQVGRVGRYVLGLPEQTAVFMSLQDPCDCSRVPETAQDQRRSRGTCCVVLLLYAGGCLVRPVGSGSVSTTGDGEGDGGRLRVRRGLVVRLFGSLAHPSQGDVHATGSRTFNRREMEEGQKKGDRGCLYLRIESILGQER
jgi:hypothetical protein